MVDSRTTISVDKDTWRAFEALRRETGLPKGQIARIAIRHLADCKTIKEGLSSLGFDVPAIENLIRTSKV